MIFPNNCRRIVRTIPGQSTGGDDDRYVCADGTVWKRVPYSEVDSTTVGVRAYKHGGHLCNHKTSV